MKKIFTFYHIIIISFWFLIPNLSTTAEPELSIMNLKARKYKGSEITIHKLLEDKGSYKSYRGSYESEGNTVYLLLNIPVSNQKKLPGVIVNHGYIPPKEYTTQGSYKNISHMYAVNGFIVLKPDYRGHGKSEGLAEGPERTIMFSIDVLNLLASLSSLSRLDEKNLFMYGHSMGGEITLRVLEITDKIKGASLWAPVSLPFPENTQYFAKKKYPEIYKQYRLAVEEKYDPDEYKLLSPLYYTSLIKIPLLLHHGTKDLVVPYNWSVDLEKYFKLEGVDYTFHTYKGENHNLSQSSYFTVVERDVVFFKKLLNK